MDTPISHKFLEGLPDFQTVLAMKKLSTLGQKGPTFLANKQTNKQATDFPRFSLTCSGAIHGGV